MPKTISALCHTAHHIPTAPVLKYLNDVAEDKMRKPPPIAMLYHIKFHIPTPLIVPLWKALSTVTFVRKSVVYR